MVIPLNIWLYLLLGQPSLLPHWHWAAASSPSAPFLRWTSERSEVPFLRWTCKRSEVPCLRTTRICETSWPPHFLDHLWSLWKFVHKSTMWLRWQLLKNFLDPGGPLHARALWSWTFLSFIFGFKMTWEVIKSYGPIVTSLFLCHVTFSSSSSCSCWPPPGCPSWSTPQRPARI